MSTNHLPIAPTADHHVKKCCEFAATVQIIAISFCVFVIIYALITSIRCFFRRHREVNNTPSPTRPAGLDPTSIAALPSYQYKHRGRGDVPVPDCTICLNEVDEGEEVKLLPICMHLFHKDCIQQWLEKNRTCPVCRTGVVHGTREDIELQ